MPTTGQAALNTFAQFDGEGDDCWVWTGATFVSGYGIKRLDGKYWRAHKLLYEMTCGEVPEGMELDHVCRNKLCVNPYHLEPVSHSENLLRYYEGVGRCRQR